MPGPQACVSSNSFPWNDNNPLSANFMQERNSKLEAVVSRLEGQFVDN